jgi:hypothetical protein
VFYCECVQLLISAYSTFISHRTPQQFTHFSANNIANITLQSIFITNKATSKNDYQSLQRKKEEMKITLLQFQTSLLFIINITVIFMDSITHTSDFNQYSYTKNVEINIVLYYCAFQYLVNIWY